MFRRTSRVVLDICGIAVGGVLVLAGLVVWRLSTAPVEASFIRPYVEQEFNRAGLGFAVTVTDARITWRQLRPILDLHVHGVSVTGSGGAAVGVVDDGLIGISVPALLTGRLRVVEIDIVRPEITIVRDEDDHFLLRLGQNRQGAAENDPQLLSQFTRAPGGPGPFGSLHRIHLVDGKATIQDGRLGIIWTAPDVDIDMSRDATETRAKIAVALAMPHHPASLDGRATFSHHDGRVELALGIHDFDAASAAPLAEALAPLAALSGPVSGDVHAIIDGAGRLIGGEATLAGCDGQIILPQYYPQPLAFKSVALGIHFSEEPRRLILDRLAIDLGDARLAVAGVADFAGPLVTISANANLFDIPMGRLDALWPHGFAVGGRDWVTTHIPEGVIKSGAVRLRASGQAYDPGSIQVTGIDGDFDYTGLEVHYFPALPPVRSIAGHGAFDARRMDLTIDSGTLEDIAVSHGAVALTGFDQDDRATDISLTLDGPLKTALSVLDTKPLGYAHDLGIAPAAVAGRLDVRATFAFPLVKTLQFSQIALGAKGTLGGVGVVGAVGRRDVTAGALTIALDKKGMNLEGGLRLAGVPLSMSWRESFISSDKVRSRIAFRSELAAPDLTALALPLPDFVGLRGKAGVSGAVAIDRSRAIILDLAADIGGADLTFDRLGWQKPAGQPGTVSASLAFMGDTLTRVSNLKLDSKDINLAGAANFGPDGSLRDAELSRIVTPRNDYAAAVAITPGPPPAYRLTVRGKRFDAEPLLAKTAPAASTDSTLQIDLDLAIDHVRTGPDAELADVSGAATLLGSRLDRAALTAKAGGAVSLSYQPEDDSRRRLRFTAEDAGQALAALALTRGVRGGSLTIDGLTRTAGGVPDTRGAIDMRDFRLTDAPIAARLLNAISLSGFVDLLSGQGLAFDRLSSDMEYEGGKLTLRDGRSAGALGISFEGDVDLDRDRVALKGTVVPVDTFNRILDAIPLLGDLLTGGSRGGLIGWTYTVTGSMDDPKVSVNALSMLAPGFLRNLFFLGPKQPDSEAAPPDAADPAKPDPDQPK
jgi:hypothetical protein